ncbi:hypothetical protein D3C72_781830 [compost metagenome]
MAAPVGEGAAGAERHLAGLVVAPARNAAFDAALEPGELAVEDEVDHARDRVRAVGRRSPAGHDVDAGDQLLGQGAGVGCAADRRGRGSAPVNQDQCATGAEVAQVQEAAGGGASRGDACIGGRGGAAEGRKLGQAGGDRAGRGELKLFSRDHRHRRRGLGAVLDRPGPGDHDLAHLGGVFVLNGSVLSRSRRGAGDAAEGGQKRQQAGAVREGAARPRGRGAGCHPGVSHRVRSCLGALSLRQRASASSFCQYFLFRKEIAERNDVLDPPASPEQCSGLAILRK